eukprot:2398823-Amphidinium_carterae.2
MFSLKSEQFRSALQAQSRRALGVVVSQIRVFLFPPVSSGKRVGILETFHKCLFVHSISQFQSSSVEPSFLRYELPRHSIFSQPHNKTNVQSRTCGPSTHSTTKRFDQDGLQGSFACSEHQELGSFACSEHQELNHQATDSAAKTCPKALRTVMHT